MRSYKENSKNKNNNLKINEALQNDITWGDSWAGRLVASLFRMAKMGVDLVAIKRLETQLENAITKDIVTKLKEEDSDFKALSTEVEDAAIQDILINCIKKDPSKLEKTLNDLKNKYGEERIERAFNNLPQEIKDILLALSQYNSNDDNVDNTEIKEVSKTIYIDMINNLKALNNILEYYDKIEIVDVVKKNDRVNPNGTPNNTNSKEEKTTSTLSSKPGNNINKNSNQNKSTGNNNTSGEDMAQVTEILKYSDFIINEKNIDTNKPLFSIRSNETHLIEAYKGLKKVIDGLISKDKGLSVDSPLISDLINNNKNSEVKTNIKEMYKQVCQFLSSGVIGANKLYTENYTVINDKSKRSIIADKIARLAKKTSQFQKENLYGGLGNSLGGSLKNFNVSMNNIIKHFKEEKESNIKPTNENFLTNWINNNKKNSDDLETTIETNNQVEVTVDGNKVTILYNDKEIDKDELIEKSSKETIESIQQKVETLDIDEKVNEYIKVANIDCLEIVRIFNNAYKIFVKNNIPSFREGGKVNTTRANNWEKLDGSGFDPSNPGGGPFRNKKLSMAWNDSVLKVMKKYDSILKSAKIVDENGKPVKAQYPITKFMIDALDDSKMFYKGHQAKYLSQHFGLKVPTTWEDGNNTPKNPLTNTKPEGTTVQKKIVKMNDNISYESSVGGLKKYGVYSLNMSIKMDKTKSQTFKMFMVGLGEYGEHILYKISKCDKIVEKYVEGYEHKIDKDHPIVNIFLPKNYLTSSTIPVNKIKNVLDAVVEPNNLPKKDFDTLPINSISNILILKKDGEVCVANNRADVKVRGNITYSHNDNNKLYTILEGTNENIITFNDFKNNIK